MDWDGVSSHDVHAYSRIMDALDLRLGSCQPNPGIDGWNTVTDQQKSMVPVIMRYQVETFQGKQAYS